MPVRFLDEAPTVSQSTTDVGKVRFLDEELEKSTQSTVRFLDEPAPQPTDSTVKFLDGGPTTPTQPQEDNSDVGRFFSGFSSAAKGFLRPFAEQLPKSAAILLDQSVEGLAKVNQIPQEEIDSFTSIEDSKVYQFGEQLGRGLDEVFPTNPEFQDEFLMKLLTGGGQLAGTIGVAAIPYAGPALALGQGALTQAASEFDAALQATGDEDTAFNTFLLNLPIGATDAIPVGRTLRRLDEVTGGSFKKAVGRIAAGSLEEFIQEGTQTYMSNIVAKDMYDASRKYMDDVVESALIGGILGGASNATLGAINDRIKATEDPKLISSLEEARKYVDKFQAKAQAEPVNEFVQTFKDAPITEEQINDPGTLKAATIAVERIRGLRGRLPEGDNTEAELRDMLEKLGYTGLTARLDEPSLSPDAEENAAQLNEQLTEVRGPAQATYEEAFTAPGFIDFMPQNIGVPDSPVAVFNNTDNPQFAINIFNDGESITADGINGTVIFVVSTDDAGLMRDALTWFGLEPMSDLQDTYAKYLEHAVATGKLRLPNTELMEAFGLNVAEGLYNPTDVKAEIINFGDYIRLGYLNSADEVLGDLYASNIEVDYLQIRTSHLEDKIRGTGLGFVAYQAMLEQASSEGKNLASDTTVSEHAQRIYEAFARRGFAVYKNDEAYQSSSGGTVFNETDNGQPIFIIIPEGSKYKTIPPNYSKFEVEGQAAPDTPTPPPTDNAEGRNLPAVRNNLPATQNTGVQRNVTTPETTDDGTGTMPPPPRQNTSGTEFGGFTRKQLPPSEPSDVSPDDPTLDLSQDQGIGTWRQKIMRWLDLRLGAPKSILKKDRTRQGQLAKEVVTVNQNLENIINALRIQHLGKDSGIDIKRFFATDEIGRIPDIVWEAMDHVLRGNAERMQNVPALRAGPREPYFDGVRMLPPVAGQTQKVGITAELINDELWGALTAARLHIDKLSRTLVREGLAEGPLELAISKNIGTYLHRAYKKNEDPKWARNVPEDVMIKAYDFIRDQYKAAGTELSDTAINNLIQDILGNTSNSEFAIIAGEKLGRVDTSPLKKRGDIAPEIRALMGEYTNPLANYVRTLGKVANIVHNGLHLREVAEQYKGIYFFDDVKDAPFGFTQRISATNNESFGALAGLYTHPEIAEAFRESYRDADTYGGLAQWAIGINSIAKYSKTVLNQITHVRNIAGGGFFMLANGHNVTKQHMKDALKAFWVVSANKTPAKFAAKMRRYAELGLDVEGAKAGELQGVINATITGSKGSNDQFLDSFNHVLTKPGSIFSKLRYGSEKMADIYRAEDVALRILMFEAENARLQDAYEGSGRTREDIEAEAAEVIKGVYQDYSRVPARIRNLSKFPLFGTFVSFQSEVIRTTFNTIERAKLEIASDNPKLRKIGWRRMAGVTAMIAVNTIAAGVGMFLTGTDEEEDKDIKQFTPPWDANSPLIYLNDDKLRRRYINPSQYNPYSLLSDPINALILGKEEEFIPTYLEAWKQLGSRFFSEEIMLQKVREVASNKRIPFGGPVYNPGQSLGEQAATITAHMWNGLEPGVINSTQRLYRSAVGRPERSGKQLDLESEVLASFFGFRTNELNVPISLRFRAIEFEKEVRDARTIFNKAKGDPRSTLRDLYKADRAANDSYGRAFEKMRRTYEGAYRLGLEPSTIEGIFKEAGVTKDRTNQVELGARDWIEFDY